MDGGVAAESRARSPRKVPLFERASARWWNPQFSSAALEAQYWRCSFPQLRDRFRSGLVYICLAALLWTLYLQVHGHASLNHWLSMAGLVAVSAAMFAFTECGAQFQRFYMPASFLTTFLICLVTLVVFSDSQEAFMSPVGSLATSVQVVLLIYTVIPLPLYLCILIGVVYSALFEILSARRSTAFIEQPGVKLALHLGVHMLGVHLFILTQVRQRKTFLKVGQSLLARKDLELETQFKDHMIQSVMPKKVADELLKDASEMRRPSASLDSNCRTSNATATLQDDNGGTTGGVPNVRKFRPFTMNLMTDVSILFADIAGFTRMSSNKSADELVNLLNDLFGRFDNLCRMCGLEKISTLGDCYYCVAGCPEPCADHARRCVEMGLEMIVAIRQFDLDRGQEVNMRVGIHTGKVMCGMVGTKRFKFDVFSNDVNLANEMESTGVAGRVHVSGATAQFLGNAYILEEGEPHAGMKTFFIAGRAKEPDESMGADSERDATVGGGSHNSQQHMNRSSQISFRKKLAGKLKTIHTNSLPMGRANVNSGGSLRMKLIDRTRPSNSTQLLPWNENNSMCLVEDARKSASLQALATNTYSSMSGNSPDSRMGWPPDRDGAKVSTANGSSANNSGKGSRSSGIQDAGSDVHSVGGLDTAISHHHNAASLTRFDTDNRDFDQRLAMLIHGTDGKFARGFWMHQDSLNPWTLRFNEKDIEDEYRAHFAESADRSAVQRTALAEHVRNTEREDVPTSSSTQYRYSGVFIDILVAGLLFALTSAVVWWTQRPPPLVFIIYFSLASIGVTLSILLIGLPLLSRRSLVPCVNLWAPRHVIGAVLIGLPVGVALCVAPLCLLEPEECADASLLSSRLLFSYIMIMALFAHCNFSQLGAWPKTLQAVFVALLHLAALYYCQHNLSLHAKSLTVAMRCNQTLSTTASDGFKTPLYVWEILVDVTLSVILVAFLNYQFEAAFRMSFFGDVQARRDTQQMQVVRDQADWLLTNIIPPHAVESLKTNTKYSENHSMTAILFASITNWNDMYEENFEGGREFLRVLNEVIGDFDELLDRPEFNQVEKIKTIGSTYMAASGLNPEKRRQAPDPKEHVYQMVEFALALQRALAVFNEDLLNFDFVCKLGLNIGPVTAGVIGTTKLYYDIWGNSVNIASRMYSTGVVNRIQVSQETRDMLADRYEFEYRDHIDVKGVDKGMDTFLLVRRKAEAVPPAVAIALEEDVEDSPGPADPLLASH